MVFLVVITKENFDSSVDSAVIFMDVEHWKLIKRIRLKKNIKIPQPLLPPQ